jgi:hypothetical protein
MNATVAMLVTDSRSIHCDEFAILRYLSAITAHQASGARLYTLPPVRASAFFAWISGGTMDGTFFGLLAEFGEANTPLQRVATKNASV